MRRLTAAQKHALDKWYAEYGKECGLGFSLEDNPNFSLELLDSITAMNDYETLHWDINRYVSDKVAKDMRRWD